MKFLVWPCAILLLAGCTTLSNRRDLYNPSADAGRYHSLQQNPASKAGAKPAEPEETLPPQ